MEEQKPQIQRAKIPLKTSSSNSHGCRIGALGDATCAAAFQNDIHLIRIGADLSANSSETSMTTSKDTFHSHTLAIEDVCVVRRGDETFLYTSDSLGSVRLSSRRNEALCDVAVSLSVSRCSRLPSWSGVTADPNDPLQFFVAHYMDKSLDYYKDGQRVITMNTVAHPTQVEFLAEKNLIVITEETHVSLWDVRQRGAVQRVYLAHPEPLNALTTQASLIAVAGESKNVSFFDTRTWMHSQTWKNCTKYGIQNLLFSTSNSHMCYVGDDSVLLCKSWQSQKKLNYFSAGVRFDSRSLGVSHSPTSDCIMALSENGVVNVIRNWSACATTGNSTSEPTDEVTEEKISKRKKMDLSLK